MIEQIIPDVYRVEIPLPKSPLKALNSYILRNRERFLVIDTGWDREECLIPMLSAMEELDVNLNKTDFFITHLHSDHIGLVGKLARKGNRVYFGEVEASVAISIRKDEKGRFDLLFQTYLSHGFPETELRRAVEDHPGFRYGPPIPFDFCLLRDGEIIDIGAYSFKCIETPGHSPGHMCLYETRKKILLSGDHILFDITPNITRWPEMDNSLGNYLESLEKVHGLDVKLVLPGHRRMMSNHRKRIAELYQHHKRRLDEVLTALKHGEKTAWEVAPYLSWDIDLRSWEVFPPVQKWFALGETIAHLKYLEANGSVLSREYRGKIRFALS